MSTEAAGLEERIDPREALAALGYAQTSDPVRIRGGWDTLIWRFETPDGSRHALRLHILPSGLVDAASPDASADLTVTVLAGALPRLLARDEAAMAQVDLAGPVDLASTVQILFRELDWDAEEDLSKIFGDILARRMVGTARDLFAWQKDAASRLAQNFAEYLTDEQPLLAHAQEAVSFRRSLEALSEDCTRLERRLEQLEARGKRGPE